MENLTIFKLHFSSPLHLSRGKTDDYGESGEILHSDTLKSALFVCARTLGVNMANEEGQKFFESFLISSAFPFFRDELFFPKPMVKLPEFEKGQVKEDRQAKKHKKITFIGKSLFEDLINSGEKKLKLSHFSKDGAFISETIDFATFQSYIMVSDVQQRVTIPNDRNSDPVPYYLDRLYFTKETGLWFAVRGSEEILTIIRKSLKLLGDEGIGTDRHVGNGHFSFSESSLHLKTPKDSDHQMILSLWCPKEMEVNPDFLVNSAYGLTKRGGYIASPANPEHLTYRKKSVYMFTEGSIFPRSIPIQGKIVDLKPNVDYINQPVWRDGQAFTIPINRSVS